MSNSLGTLFRVTTFGESHGTCIGVLIDGCPAGVMIHPEDIQNEVEHRRAGKAPGSTERVEKDRVEILSGLYDGYTTGAPICLLVYNRDVDSRAYGTTRRLPRPGHADFPGVVKYGGFGDLRGGGRFSGRVTVAYVMAGAVARRVLSHPHIELLAHTVEIAGVVAQAPADWSVVKHRSAGNALRCADPAAARSMERAIERAAQDGDSVGGIVEAVALGLPVGLGEPVCDTLEGELAKAYYAIPAVKGVEFGAGFAAARKRGSANNDAYVVRDGVVTCDSNNAGGALGGMSTGMPLTARLAIKPTSSIGKPQQTIDLATLEQATVEVRGRHDACIVPRAVPVVEAMTALVLCDFALRAGIIPRVLR
jgi:chorismate synthase